MCTRRSPMSAWRKSTTAWFTWTRQAPWRRSIRTGRSVCIRRPRRAGHRSWVGAYPNWVEADSRRERRKARVPPRFFALMDPVPLRIGEDLRVREGGPDPVWRVPAKQRFVIEEFDDGIVMFDVLVGATHLLNVSAVDTLAIVSESPGLQTAAIHLRLL